MKKENKIIVVIITLLFLLAVSYCVYLIINNKRITTDAIKFRNEYMELNDKVNEDTKKLYSNVIISEKNTVKYLENDNIERFLKEETGIVYFCEETSSWCRSLTPILVEEAINRKENIYYVNIRDMHSVFELNNDQIVKIKDGSDEYYKILEKLKDYLEDFYLIDEEGNKYYTNEKKLTIPTLVALKNGEITGFHSGTVESQKNGYEKLEKEEISELKETINNLFDSKNVFSCSIDENC